VTLNRLSLNSWNTGPKNMRREYRDPDLIIAPNDNRTKNEIDGRKDHEVPVVGNLGLEDQIQRGWSPP
jgi:hypothetical protein